MREREREEKKHTHTHNTHTHTQTGTGTRKQTRKPLGAPLRQSRGWRKEGVLETDPSNTLRGGQGTTLAERGSPMSPKKEREEKREGERDEEKEEEE